MQPLIQPVRRRLPIPRSSGRGPTVASRLGLFRALAALCLALLLGACGDPLEPQQQAPPDDGQAAGETTREHIRKHLDPKYVCPMHPQIVQDTPASCPLCGMDLVEKRVEPSASTPVVALSEATVQKLGVRSASVERGRLWKLIKTVGYVRYNDRRTHTVYSKTGGWVENLGVRTAGRYVTRGQLLLELYSPEFLEVQKAYLAAQQVDASGQLKKYGQRAESVAPRDHLRYLDISESLMNELARTGVPRHRIPVYAPQQGTIVRHQARKHMYVYPGQPMFTIADLSTVWVELDVFEHQMSWVERGQYAEIEVDAFPGHSFKGRVNYIYPELDANNRTLKVRLRVPNPDGLLQPNMFAHARIFGGPKDDVLKIPRQALIATGERQSVIKDLGEGRFKAVDVVAGMRSQDEVEILSGLEEGDRVVVSGQFLIDSEANLQASFQRMDAGDE